jgi:hypothetical protein
MQQKMQDQQRQSQKNNRPEGDVTIENKKTKNNQGSDEEEYVDFEEID